MEEQQKSEAPQLIEIAARILGGLLASGDLTEVKLSSSDSGYGSAQFTKVRPEAVTMAVNLALQLKQSCDETLQLKAAK